MTRRAYSPGLGKWIAVKTLDIPDVPAKAKRRRQEGAFVVWTLREAAIELNAIKCPTTMVWLALRYERWRQKGNTIRLPTSLLRSLGLTDRKAWARALTRIERAGLARVERHHGRAARVTFTPPNRR
jgi:hypothetical protein